MYKKKFIATIISSCLLGVIGCGGGSSGSSGNDQKQEDSSKTTTIDYIETSNPIDVFSNDSKYYSTTLKFDGVVKDITTEYGGVEFDSDTNSYIYTISPILYENRTINFYLDTITYKKLVVDDSSSTNGSLDSLQSSNDTEEKWEEKKQYLRLYDDPLFFNQWHIRNVGQDNYKISSVTNQPGYDMRVVEAWKQGVTGEGVNILVHDEDLEITHEDLADNVLANASYNFANSSTDPSLGTSYPNKGHGTSVAGIIAGVRNNGIGISGIAYKSKIFGYNAIHPSYIDTTNTVLKTYIDIIKNKRSDLVVNESFGLNSETTSEENTYYDSLYDLNVSIVKSIGNEYEDVSSAGLTSCKYYGTPCSLIVNSQSLAMPAIMVAAVDIDGKHTYYSSANSTAWISAFSGEKTRSIGILTTDRSGCSYGYSRTNNTVYSDFTTGKDSSNSKCNYNNIFDGTSAAAPQITGIVALMRDASNQRNANLSNDQLRYILAKTAYYEDTMLNDAVTLSQYHVGISNSNSLPINLAAQSLSTNSNIKFSNKYGFGLADAGEAVKYILEDRCDSDDECKIRTKDNEVKTFTLTLKECKSLKGKWGNQIDCYFNTPKDYSTGQTISNTEEYSVDNITVGINNLCVKVQGSGLTYNYYCYNKKGIESNTNSMLYSLNYKTSYILENADTNNLSILKAMYQNYLNSTSSDFATRTNAFYLDKLTKDSSYVLHINTADYNSYFGSCDVSFGEACTEDDFTEKTRPTIIVKVKAFKKK